MGVRLRNDKNHISDTRGNCVKFKDINLSGHDQKNLSITIKTNFHDIEIYGTTVHELLQTIFEESNPKTKALIKDWMEWQIKEYVKKSA